MTIKVDMAEAAGECVLMLGDATSLVEKFLGAQICRDGGFAGRSPKSDLYYTVFGIAGLQAVGSQPEYHRFQSYLSGISCEKLTDLVHLAAYIRCRALSGMAIKTSKMAELMIRFRTRDGGFGNFFDKTKGNIYSCFLALGAYQDMDCEMPDENKLLNFVESLKLDGGGYVNRHGSKAASAPTTAAAMAIRYYLDGSKESDSLEWLAKQRKHGGFIAGESVCAPDLLSTAVSLYSLGLWGEDVGPWREETLDFIDSLWSGRGGFHGNWFDNVIDCEYTYYGLLALGNLIP